MADHKWDFKSNYMLAFTVCKYGLDPERWDLIANDLADYINTTPQNCQTQFGHLCQQYGQDWQKQSVEPLHNYIFTTIKRLYYGNLCEQMNESRSLLNVTYDFIRLFKIGRITAKEIEELLQDIKNTPSTTNNTHDNERQLKIEMLDRLKGYMTQQNCQTSNTQFSSFPVPLLPPPPPPPPFFHHHHHQQQPTIPNYNPQDQVISHTNENDRQVPSLDKNHIINNTDISSFPIIIQSNNLLIENETQYINNHSSNDVDIDEIELSSDDDDDANERTTTTTTTVQMLNYEEPTASSNLMNDQDESTFVSDEQMDTNQSSSMQPMTTEISDSNDRDLYENANTGSINNQSTSNTRLSGEEQARSSNSDQPISSSFQVNRSINGSNDYIISDNEHIQSIQNNYHHLPNEIDFITTTPTRIAVDDDEVARMDAEQIPEPIPADITDVTVPNDNAMFIVDESISNTNTPEIPTNSIDQQSIASNIASCSETYENDDSIAWKNIRRQSRLTTSSSSNNSRKSMNIILNNLKTAKYGYDFAKSLKSFKLSDDYYDRIKKPLDIPEIRERMNNGDYDDSFLLFERDVLLMFTNALSMYHRDVEIHKHTQYMINYAMELFTSMNDAFIPWKTKEFDNLSNVYCHNNDNNTINSSSSITRTSSVSSSVRTDSSSTKNLRRQGLSKSLTPKRQRKIPQ
ncbi:unnamed protein product [Adineta steineri]|uniref:Bromo domain-containing protein n=1 Tax=Adineta steineri TaxID=433720 RepID=A0A814YFU7_9BILA|nr:unnamed protein product [Adineta steineri]